MHKLLPAISFIAFASTSVIAQNSQPDNVSGMPTSGGYKPPALSLSALMTEESPLGNAMMTFATSGDSAAFLKEVETEAASGNIGAQLLLAEQYIPEQCTFEPDRDVPHCGKEGNEVPKVVFRSNPLQIPASYEYAAQWLERASAQGSGEASEILAQLIARMLANGHVTTYTDADSKRLHALARSQGIDVEAIRVTCFQRKPGPGPVALEAKEKDIRIGQPPQSPISDDQISTLRTVGLTGTLRFNGSSGSGDSTLLSRPEGPPVSIILSLDHDPGHEFHLPIPAHHDGLFVQQGDAFLSIPDGQPNLPRFLSVMPQREENSQVSFFIQLMDGGFSGGSCGRF